MDDKTTVNCFICVLEISNGYLSMTLIFWTPRDPRGVMRPAETTRDAPLSGRLRELWLGLLEDKNLRIREPLIESAPHG
jgi:hypothetical protein